MSAMAAQLDFRFANEGGSFIHSLRTVVLDPERRVCCQFDGDKWKADELAQAMADAARLSNGQSGETNRFSSARASR